jgi:hypothetical protein
VTEWNFARERMVEAFSGPECRIMSGREVLIGDVGLSFWMVMYKRWGGGGSGFKSFFEGAGAEGLRRISPFERKKVMSLGNRG